MKNKRFFKYMPLVLLVIIFSLSAGPLFAGGTQEEEPTELQMTSQPRQYISPAAADGVQDELQLPFSELVLPGTDRVIVSWAFTVFDGSGVVVFLDTKEETARRTGLAELFKIGDKPKVTIPEELSWDGTYQNGGDNDGQPVEDGEYTYQITITNDKGELVKTPPFNVTVDNTAPAIGELETDHLIFSPVGKRNTLTFDQTGSREYLWEGVFKDDSDTTVRTFTWENDTNNISRDVGPEEFIWDGTDDAGEVLPEGEYTYELTGNDRAGNTVNKVFENTVTLSMKEAGIEVALSREIFSPGLNTIDLDFTLSDPDSLMNWHIDIADKRNTRLVRWSKEGGSTPPETVPFDGKDISGRNLPDGVYVVNFSVDLINGDILEAVPAEFTVDTEKPTAYFEMDTKPLPTERNFPFYIGGKNREYIDVRLKVSPEDPWTVIIETEDGTKLTDSLSNYGITGDTFQFKWYGTDFDGDSVPNGKYTGWLTSTDAAGNYGESNKVRVTVERTQFDVSLQTEDFIFSPRKEGMKDTVRITVGVDAPDMVEVFGFYIKNSKGKIVRSREIRSTLEYFDWDGRSNSNAYVPDGLYTAKLTVLYKNGHTAEASANPVMVYTITPKGILSSDTRIIGTDENPSVTFTLSPEKEADWNLVFLNEEQRLLKVPFSEDNTGNYIFVWDGKDETGEIVPEGYYVVYAAGINEAGLRGETNRVTVKKTIPVIVEEPVIVEPVIIEPIPPVARISVEGLPLSPDNDGENEEVTIRLSSTKGTDDIVSWQVRIFEPTGVLFKTFQGRGTPPFRMEWNGKSNYGELVQSGEIYPVHFTVRDTEGRTGEVHDEILVDILVMKEGDKYRIIIPSIHFAPYSPSLFTLEEEEVDSNLKILQRLASKLEKFPDYNITVEGHAAHVFWTDPVRREIEQRDELLPLSTSRAVTVMQAMMILGIERDRLSTIGLGGSDPVVPHIDLENLWKNRRVEFLLEK